jgi:RNA polymerase sigma-70 factor (ECF subfamily)
MPDPALARRPPPLETGDPSGREGGAAPADEAALLARARAGDTRAFGVLVERHQDRAYAVALRITRSPVEAAEAAQEGMVRAWRALPGFRGEAAFGTWLHRVVARRALDRAEALRARRGREVEEEAAHAEPADPPPERDLLLAERLERMLGNLSPAQRAAVTLYYLEGQGIDAVAAALDMPPNTVKTHLHRARASLREAWGRQERAP